METPKPETTRNSIDVFEHLLTRARNTPMDQLEQRWHLLEAAHIVGQTRFEPHLRVHVAMLNLAWQSKDLPELAGQLFRITLVPVGHLVGRLPIGNPGRANVSAFEPMQPSSKMLQTIAESRQSL
nr:DUF3703 domain-containing protein [uncultured Rhodoferax sp.]